MFAFNTCENNVTGDIYVGSGSGKQLQEAIQNAKRRIWILSPYISSETVNVLVDKYDRDVNIKLITSEKEVRKVRKSESKISNFIIETGTPDTIKLTKFIIAISTALVLFISALAVMFFFFITKTKDSVILLLSFIFVSPIFFLLRYALNIKFMNYSYATKIPIYFLKDPYSKYMQNNIQEDYIPFLHAKIYLIDDTVFIGSVNFTKEGFDNNIETRFKTENKKFVDKMVDLFLAIQNAEKLTVDIPTLGYRVFHKNKFFNVKKK